jgi:hypothetical protein
MLVKDIAERYEYLIIITAVQAVNIVIDSDKAASEGRKFQFRVLADFKVVPPET